MKKILLGILLLLIPTLAYGQGRYDNIVIGPRGPVANATIAVCTQPANTSTTPCSTLATLYTDSTLGTVAPNPFLADDLGNYHFYTTNGVYTVQIYSPQLPIPFIMKDQNVGVGGGGGAIPGGTDTAVQVNHPLGTLFGDAAFFSWNDSTQTLTATNISGVAGNPVNLTAGFQSLGIGYMLAQSATSSSGNFQSPALGFFSAYWNGTTSRFDTWVVRNIPGTGVNPQPELQFLHNPGTLGSTAAPTVFFGDSPVTNMPVTFNYAQTGTSCPFSTPADGLYSVYWQMCVNGTDLQWEHPGSGGNGRFHVDSDFLVGPPGQATAGTNFNSYAWDNQAQWWDGSASQYVLWEIANSITPTSGNPINTRENIYPIFGASCPSCTADLAIGGTGNNGAVGNPVTAPYWDFLSYPNTDGFTAILQHTTLTANRTFTFPDATGILPVISGTPTTGNCVSWVTPITIGDAGAACGSGGSGMVWPAGGAGIGNYTGSSAWGTTYNASNTIPANFISALPYISTTLTSAHINVGNGSNVATSVALSGDCTMANTGAITCTKSSGTSFGTGAFATIANYAALAGATFTGSIVAPTMTDSGLTGGNCVQAGSGGLLTTAASPCGSGGGTPGTPLHAVQFNSASAFAGTTVPATAGQFPIGYTIACGSSTAVDPSVTQLGSTPRDVSGSSDTIACTDNLNPIIYNGSGAVAVSLPTPTTLSNTGFSTQLVNHTSGSSTAVTVTSTTLTFDRTSSTTLVIPQGQACKITADSGGTVWDTVCHNPPLSAGTGIALAPAQYGLTVGLGSAHGIETPLQCSDTSGSGTAQSCTTTPTFVPAKGDAIIYYTTTANTSALTLNVNSSAADAVQKWQGTALASGDIKANIPVLMNFDGSHWQLQNIGNVPSGAGVVTTIGAGSNQLSAVVAANTTIQVAGADTESSAVTVSVANVTIQCVNGGSVQFTGATDGFDVTGNNFVISPGCILDHNSQSGSGTGPLVNFSAGTGLNVSGVTFNNVGVTNANTATIYVNGTAGKFQIINNIVPSTTDTFLLVKSAGTATIQDGIVRNNLLSNCALTTASSYCINYQDSTNNFVKNILTEGNTIYFTGSTETAFGQNFTVQSTGEAADEGMQYLGNKTIGTGAVTAHFKAYGNHHNVFANNIMNQVSGSLTEFMNFGDTYFTVINANVMEDPAGSGQGECVVIADFGRDIISNNTCDGVTSNKFGIQLTNSAVSGVGADDTQIVNNNIKIKAGSGATCIQIVNATSGATAVDQDNDIHGNHCLGDGTAAQNGILLTTAAGITITNTVIGPNYFVNLGGTGISINSGSAGTVSNTRISPQQFDTVTTPFADNGTGTVFDNHAYFGSVTLSAGTGTFTLPAGAAASATGNWTCIAQDQTTLANPVKCTPTSTTAATVTGTGTDVATIQAFVH